MNTEEVDYNFFPLFQTYTLHDMEDADPLIQLALKLA